MSQESLGLIETIGLAAAVAAADAAVKSANVTLVGYELAKGDGMTLVKLRGDVGAVKAAVAAAEAEAGRVGRVVATRVIARPARDLANIVDSRETVGVERPDPAGAEPVAKPLEDARGKEPTTMPEAVAVSSSSTGGEAIPAVAAPPDADPPEADPRAVDTPAADAPAAEAPAAEASEPSKPQPPRPPLRPNRHHRGR